MKKHNETRSKKILVQKNGKVIRKAISFAMIFVMLFCISAYAETETISVYNQESDENEIISVNVDITETNEYLRKIYNINTPYVIVSAETQDIKITYQLNNGGTTYELYIKRQYTENNIVLEVLGENANQIINTSTTLYNVYIYHDGVQGWYDTDFELTEGGAGPLKIRETLQFIVNTIQNPETFVPENVIVTEIEPPIYEGFIGNARGLFDMLFESIQSIFNWLVSPNVIVIFGLGIILSISTIGILIARRFFWGR